MELEKASDTGKNEHKKRRSSLRNFSAHITRKSMEIKVATP
jgi:hypothetical protein